MSHQIRRVGPQDVIDLRHQVLRAGLPRQTAIFPGDDHPDARHYGAWIDGNLIGCVTLHPSQWEGQPAWQLRGMAVAPGHQSAGIGTDMIRFLESDLSDSPVQQLWCNARVPAAGFYEKLGWKIVSEIFEVPTAGPHVKMIKTLPSP
ncbi:MAG TPA: GNAT family N-acetyltransferase [Tepidisphaeraceae bacterium]|nr:GNAT family N-acetyltransferase [Tepidisphaeraceae bacterium]